MSPNPSRVELSKEPLARSPNSMHAVWRIDGDPSRTTPRAVDGVGGTDSVRRRHRGEQARRGLGPSILSGYFSPTPGRAQGAKDRAPFGS
ncbi:hypothetical protein HPB47_009355 [Ixodes persulcatus]|uniref:Uncharacterized protein n=1 Tax=Ixodes persulcatus TaxID=34615 RepID=A0AC60P2F7_IXOPE|nr:hypothetical protein HPB47_009355 [Ixodes persulcatus]